MIGKDRDGGFAEFIRMPAQNAHLLPDAIPFEQGAILMCSSATALHALRKARVAAGDAVAVFGVGGLGVSAIQLARARGSRVFATAGSAEKCAACERLGAERAINYHEADFVAVVRELTAGRGVDVVLDMVGGEYLARNIDVLATEGRLVEIATLHGVKAELNIQTVMVRRLTITGSTLRARSVEEKGAVASAVRVHLWPLLESGAVKPVLHATFPLRDAAEAHRVMESGAHIGKLVLVASS